EMDPGVIEAADAVGMTGWQKLRLVEAPLAAPYIMAGIRTAAVWTIGAATLSTTIGQPSLGDPIFAGLQTQNWATVLAGCLAAAALALAVDGLLALVEHGIGARRPALAWIGLAILALGLAWAAWPRAAERRETIVVGAKNFSEQFILARLIGARLERAGYAVEYREGLGSAVVFRALEAGDINVYVDYAGTLWTNEFKRADNPPRAAMLLGIGERLNRPQGARLIGALGFENAYAFAMRGDVAKANRLASLADLVAAAPKLTLGADLEFLDRPEWAAVKAAYPLRFAATRKYSPTFMYRALASGDAQVITAFSSDGRIAADKLTVLADPRSAIPNYDALLLASSRCAAAAKCRGALEPVVGAIPVAAMREANYQVDRESGKRSPAQAAEWLARRLTR
ncbi:MAG TPA: glycine betaine ABC transporter substrate-binding protein, partial [Novosphingobium sp.]|nr:glycine betaine ABC transporter substrate-binding protein [Novosphingobium sp.]